LAFHFFKGNAGASVILFASLFEDLDVQGVLNQFLYGREIPRGPDDELLLSSAVG